jgi:hypothetical protein
MGSVQFVTHQSSFSIHHSAPRPILDLESPRLCVTMVAAGTSKDRKNESPRSSPIPKPKTEIPKTQDQRPLVR